MIDANLLAIICCPETRQSLELADATLAAKINGDIEARLVKNAGGETVTEIAEEFLITTDKKRAYAVRMGIPVLLADEAILL